MKKVLKCISFIVVALMLMTQMASAMEYMVMFGNTSSDAQFVSLLVIDGDVTDITKITYQDIRYVDQSTVDEYGNFSIVLPFFDEDEYGIHSNLDFNIGGGEEKIKCYVSSSGSDSNDGFSQDTSVKSLAVAYSKILLVDEIILMDDTTFVTPPACDGTLTIKGNTSSVKLTVSGEISLAGNLTIDNLELNGAATIYANGHKLKVTETVTSDAGIGKAASGKSLTVYGGKKSADHAGDTNLELLGGKYYRVYGGGRNGAVNGNTNVVFGGNSNIGDGINDDDKETLSLCYVYGGGSNGEVSGKTNVTIKDNAVSCYVYGAGEGTDGTAKDTNIYINGGKVMNVYGGSPNEVLTDCDTHITMTAGLVESIFGGSYSTNMTGNTFITLSGGNIKRRVYSGCYNNYEILDGGWKSDVHVTGTTNLMIYPNILLVTKNELHSKNQTDMGIYAGSRVASNYSDEENRLIFLDDSYSTQSGKIGMQDVLGGLLYSFKSHCDYTVKATTGGKVEGTPEGGTVYVKPDNGYYATIGNTDYDEGSVKLSSETTEIKFNKKNFFIYDVSANKGENVAVGNANINADNSTANEPEPKLYISVFDYETGQLIDCDVSEATTGEKEFTLNCKFEEGKRYIIKAMMWNKNMEPLTRVYSFELK